MSIETAVDQSLTICKNNLVGSLQSVSSGLPLPRGYLVGQYLGREEILSAIPAITIEGRNTAHVAGDTGWEEVRHLVWVWAFVGHTQIETLHRWIMGYGEATRRLMHQQALWGAGWHNPIVSNTTYTNVFSAPHNLLQGCRIETQVHEIITEG